MKKSMAFLRLAMVGALVLLIVFPTSVLAQIPNYFHSIIVKKSGLCLDVKDGDASDRANVWQWSYNGTDAQLWRLKPSSIDGYYSLVAKSSGKCLDVEKGDTTKGANVQQFTCNGTDAQLWSLECNDNGYCSIVSKNSGMCLDVEGGDITKGANVQQYTCNGTDAQLWKLIAKGDVDANGELGIGDAITALKVSAGMDAEVSRNADLDGDGKISVKDANYMLVAMGNNVGETIDKRFAGVYYVDKPDRSTHTETGLYPLVVETNGDVYIKGDKIRYRYDRWGDILVFDWQYINDDLKKGQIVFSDYPDGKNRFDGTIVSTSDGESVAFSGTQMLKTQIWATPTNFPLVDLLGFTVPIGDHTWITMNDKKCWRVLGGKTEHHYCTNPDLWDTIGNTIVYDPPYSTDSAFDGRVARLLNSTAEGNIDKINCMGGDVSDFLGIAGWSKYAGIVYGLQGVCHQMTNRLLLGAGNLTVAGSDSFVESAILYGIYGTTIPTKILDQIPTGEICSPEICTPKECFPEVCVLGVCTPAWCTPEDCVEQVCSGPLNPIYLAALELIKTMAADFVDQSEECEVSFPLSRRSESEFAGMSDIEKFAYEVLRLHKNRKIKLARKEIFNASPDELKTYLLENHKIHMQELKLLFDFKAGDAISENRRNDLLAIYDKMLKPSENLLDRIVNSIPKSNEEQTPLKRSSRASIDPETTYPLILAREINSIFMAQQKQVADFLTYDEYVTLFDHDPDENIGIVDPRMMTGNSK